MAEIASGSLVERLTEWGAGTVFGLPSLVKDKIEQLGRR